MMPFNTSLNHIHFIGICGTAMGSLAVLLQKRGYTVTGSDANVYPPMSTFLEDSGIAIKSGYAESHLNPSPDLVVIGNAVSRGNAEVEAVLEQGIRYISQAELLREFFIRGNQSMVVTGTHGKTTTTSILAWIFEVAEKKPGFMIGGISENFGTSCREGAGDYFVTEGDEYDTVFFDKRSKFFHYQPHQVIINNLEFDHADIFDSIDDIKKAFRLMLRLVPRNGLIVANGDDPEVLDVVKSAHSPVLTFGTGDSCTLKISEIIVTPEGTQFKVDWSEKMQQSFKIPLTGEYNVRNAVAALAVAHHHGISVEQIQDAFDQFQNVKRRQELRGVRRGIHIYDDFAHHPTAIRATVKAIRQKHPEQRLIAIFEPRSNTSVQNMHQEAMNQAFAEADWVILAPPHRLENIPVEKRLDVEGICQAVRAQNHQAWSINTVEEIVERLVSEGESGDIILVMSNGKFGNIHQQLLDRL